MYNRGSAGWCYEGDSFSSLTWRFLSYSFWLQWYTFLNSALYSSFGVPETRCDLSLHFSRDLWQGLPYLQTLLFPSAKGMIIFLSWVEGPDGRILLQQCLLSLTFIFPVFLPSLRASWWQTVFIYLCIPWVYPSIATQCVCWMNYSPRWRTQSGLRLTAFCRSPGFPLWRAGQTGCWKSLREDEEGCGWQCLGWITANILASNDRLGCCVRLLF